MTTAEIAAGPKTEKAQPTGDQRPYRFVAGIQKLYERGETAKLAQLRRAAGDPLGANLRLAWFFEQLTWSASGVNEWQEETYFLVATLMAFDRRALEGRQAVEVSNLGHTLRLLKDANPGSAEAIDRRFRILLDAGLDELPFRLRQMVKLILSRNGTILWGRLLTDLLRWEQPSRGIQKAWARSFYTGDNTSAAPSVTDIMLDKTYDNNAVSSAQTEKE